MKTGPWLEKQAVSPRDQMVFCPLRYSYVHVDSCFGCDRFVRADENVQPRYVICDARMLERAAHPTSRRIGNR